MVSHSHYVFGTMQTYCVYSVCLHPRTHTHTCCRSRICRTRNTSRHMMLVAVDMLCIIKQFVLTQEARVFCPIHETLTGQFFRCRVNSVSDMTNLCPHSIFIPAHIVSVLSCTQRSINILKSPLLISAPCLRRSSIRPFSYRSSPPPPKGEG